MEDRGLQYQTTDLQGGPGVDYAANFEREEDLKVFADAKPFGSILILNVLEHTFEPLRILDNARTLLRPGGTMVVLTPTVWPLHEFPQDIWRLLPQFYEEFARRRGLELVAGAFEYVGFGPVSTFRNPDGSYRLPHPGRTTRRTVYGRIIHRLFNTFGRGTLLPSHVATAVVLRVPSAAEAPTHAN